MPYLCIGFRSPKQLKQRPKMKKVTFFLSALALVAFAACSNAAEEAVVEETMDTTMVEEPVTEDTTAAAATEEVAAEGAEATAE